MNEHDKHSGRKSAGTSEGGSRIYRYSGQEFHNPNLGIPDEEHALYQEKREQIYEEIFGPSEKVYHELIPIIPHIDIYIHGPNTEREFYTLVTSGMSAIPMMLPDAVSKMYARSEIVLYCVEPKQEYLDLLRLFAHFPHDNQTWLSYGHTMPNGNPPEPIFANNPELDTFLFMPSIVQPDSELDQRLILDGDPVNLLWMVPISTAECQYKLEHGMDNFYDILDQNSHPFILDPDRKSYQ